MFLLFVLFFMPANMALNFEKNEKDLNKNTSKLFLLINIFLIKVNRHLNNYLEIIWKA
jgi:hypothetical protein